MSDLLKRVSSKIKFFRRQSGLTQVQLAGQSEVDYRHLQKMETNPVDLKLSTVSKLAETLNVPACYFLDDNGTQELLSMDLGCPARILEALPLSVFALDAQGTVAYANQAFINDFGMASTDILGKWKFSDLFAGESNSAPESNTHTQCLKNQKMYSVKVKANVDNKGKVRGAVGYMLELP